MCALLLLCGCERKAPEAAESRIPPVLPDRFYPPDGWAWGRLQVEGAPPLRYGVAAPPRAMKAQVLILPDAGEPAEAWFETANDLVARNYGVWVLDWAGQGGSARWPGTADRLYATSLDPDVAALRRMVDQVVRPRTHGPLVLVGDGMGAQLALRALSQNPADVAGAVLGSPALTSRPLGLAQPFGDWGADIAGRIGFGRPFVAGQHSWRAPDRIPPGRDGVVAAWMKSDPDLRVGGASLAWTAAYNRSAAAARDPAALGRTTVSVLMMASAKDKNARNACFSLKDCRFITAEGAPPHLAADVVRAHWLAETSGFIEVRTRGHAAAAPLTAGSSPSGGSGL